MFRTIAMSRSSLVLTAIQKGAEDTNTQVSGFLKKNPLPKTPFSGIVGHTETIQRFKHAVDTFLDRYDHCIRSLIEQCGESKRGIPLGETVTADLFKDMPPLSSLLVLHGDYGDGKTSLMLALCDYIQTTQALRGSQKRYFMLIREADKEVYYLSTRQQVDAVLNGYQTEKKRRELKGGLLGGGVLMTLAYIMANYAYFAAKLVPSADRMIVCQDMDLPLANTDDPLKYATLTQNMMGPHDYVTQNVLYKDRPLFTVAFNYAYAFQLFNDLLLACQGFLLLWLLGNVGKHRHDNTPYVLQNQGVPVVVGGVSPADLMGFTNPNAAVPQQRVVHGKASTSFGGPIIFENLDELSHEQQAMLLKLMRANSYTLPGSTSVFPFSMLILATTNHPERLISDMARFTQTHDTNRIILPHPSLIPDPDHQHTFHLMQLINQKGQSGELPQLTDGAWGGLLRHIRNEETDAIRVNRTLWMALSAAPSTTQPLDAHRLMATLKRSESDCVDQSAAVDGICDAYCDRIIRLFEHVAKTPDGIGVNEVTPQMIQPIPGLMVVGAEPQSFVTEIETKIKANIEQRMQQKNASMGLVAFQCDLEGVTVKLMTSRQIEEMQSKWQQKEANWHHLQRVCKGAVVAYTTLFLLTEAYKGWVVNGLIKSHDSCVIPGVTASDTAIIKSLKEADSFHALIYLLKVMLTAISHWMSTLAIAKALYTANDWVTGKENRKPVVLVPPSASFAVRAMATGITPAELKGEWVNDPLLPPQQRLKIGENTLSWASVITDSMFGYASKEDQIRVASMITERSTQTAHGNCPFIGTFILGVNPETSDRILDILTASGRLIILKTPPAPPVSDSSQSSLHSTNTTVNRGAVPVIVSGAPGNAPGTMAQAELVAGPHI